MTVREYCPVGELAGNRHRYDVGTGVVIPWDVAGDPRSGVECCQDCAMMRNGESPVLCDRCGEPCHADDAVTDSVVTLCGSFRGNGCGDRFDEIDAYLRVRDYESVEDWAADSDYVRHGDEWRDEHGNTVDIHECLIGVLDEQLRAHE